MPSSAATSEAAETPQGAVPSLSPSPVGVGMLSDGRFSIVAIAFDVSMSTFDLRAWIP